MADGPIPTMGTQIPNYLRASTSSNTNFTDEEMKNMLEKMYGLGSIPSVSEIPDPNKNSTGLMGYLGLGDINTDKIAKGLGFSNAGAMKDFGGIASGLTGFGSTLYGMYNQGRAADLAKENYDFQKSMVQKQWDEAMKDKAEFKANQAATTKKYYGLE